MVLRLGWTGTYIHTQHDDFDEVVDGGAIPIIHDQHLTVTEARLSLDAGLTARFGASLALPLRLTSTTIVYRDGMGSVVQLVNPNIHHRDETLTGLGDPVVLGAFTERYITVRAGVSVPLGRIEEDPFALGALGEPHEHIQFGTGTVNPVVSIDGSYAWDAWKLGAYVFTQQILYENAKGYQAGDRYAAGGYARRSFGRPWSVRAGVDVQAETSERWHGVVHKEEGNQGRIDAMVAIGGAWAATDALAFDAQVRIPFITHVVGGQLDMPAIVEIGLAYRFGKAPGHHHHDGDDDDDDHDHAHDHGTDRPPVDTTGADVVDLGPPGAAVELAPVRGKLTIFEFGATWCEPCKTLEPVLVELAKRHPDTVALRRIDVVDWDSPVATKYLAPKAYDLPHVRVFDASGKLAFERSSAPGKLGALIDDVRALVEPPATTPTPTNQTPTNQTTPTTNQTTPTTNQTTPTTNQTTPLPNQTTSPTNQTTRPTPPKPYRVEIEVTEKGFTPAEVKVPHDRAVILVFTRKTNKTCANDVVLPGGTVKDLPLNTPVEIQMTFTTPGPLGYHCGMNMVKGTIIVQ